ncbi:MAG: histidine kinase [Saprospiraceae bacterium]
MLRAVFLFAFAILAARLSGQYVFSHLDKPDGLPSAHIQDVMQDRDGYIWIASEGGLCRYNGSQIKVFQPDARNPNAIRTAVPRSLMQAADGKIWVGSRDGAIDVFDPETGHFSPILMPDSLIGYVWGISQDKNGQIWVANNEGLLRFSPTENALRAVSPSRVAAQTRRNFMGRPVMSIAQSPAEPDLLFLGSQSAGIFRYRISLDSLDEIRCPFPEVRRTGRLFWHGNGRFYFYTAPNWLVEFDPSAGDGGQGAFQKFEIPGALPSRASVSLLQKSAHELWVPTRNRGLGIFRTDDHSWQFLEHDPEIRTSIRPGGLYAMCLDRRGDLWLGTQEQGVEKLDLNKNYLQHFFLRKPLSAGREDLFAYDALPLPDGTLLVSTFGESGLYVFDKNGQLLRQANAPKGERPDIKSLFLAANGRVLAAATNGLFEVNLKKLALEKPKIGPEPLPTGNFGKFLADASGNCWALSRSKKGLLKMSADLSGWEMLDATDPRWAALQKIPMGDFAFDAQGNIWVVGDGGVVFMDLTAGKSRFFNHEVFGGDNGTRFFGNLVIDHAGRVWVGHDHRGLAFFDGRNFDIAATTFPEVKHLDKKDGLPANIGNLTTIDKNGNIWFGSEEGLSLIDPETKTIRNFGTEDGLLRLNLNYGQHGSLTRLEDGRILVGGMGYFTLFDPARLPRNEEPPPVAIDEVVVREKDMETQFPTARLKSLTLNYLQNNLTINFAALNFISPEKNRFRYRMEGLSSDWQTSASGSVTYSQLPPGRYVFHVLAANNDGVWNTEGKRLEIIIRPPFYQTWWFYLLCALAAAFGAFRFYRWRIGQVTERARLETAFNRRLAEVQMSALRAQMNPHFLFNSLNSIKNYIAQNDPRLAARYLTKFSRLMRLILNNSKTHAVKLSLELETLDLYLELEQMRFAQKFDYQIIVSPEVDAETIEIPPMILQPFIENAIWHGFMTKPSKGHLRLEISKQGGGLVIEIDDDGIGRQRAAALQSESGEFRQSHGLGITHERLDLIRQLFQREIRVEILDKTSADGLAAGTLVRLTVLES